MATETVGHQAHHRPGVKLVLLVGLAEAVAWLTFLTLIYCTTSAVVH